MGLSDALPSPQTKRTMTLHEYLFGPEPDLVEFDAALREPFLAMSPALLLRAAGISPPQRRLAAVCLARGTLVNAEDVLQRCQAGLQLAVLLDPTLADDVAIYEYDALWGIHPPRAVEYWADPASALNVERRRQLRIFCKDPRKIINEPKT